jgi:hypothetical protein
VKLHRQVVHPEGSGIELDTKAKHPSEEEGHRWVNEVEGPGHGRRVYARRPTGELTSSSGGGTATREHDGGAHGGGFRKKKPSLLSEWRKRRFVFHGL